MKKMTVLAGLVGLFSMSAMASLTTDTVAASLSSTSANLGSTITVTVDQFDSSLGTLLGVTFLVQGAESVYFVSAANSTVTLNNGLITLGDGVSSATVNLSYNKDVTASAGKTLSTFVQSNNPGTDFTSNLGAYTGNGTYDLSLSYSGTWGATGGATLSSERGISTAVSYYYTYDVVPEPTSLSLIALGVMAVGLRRRFKKTV